MRGETECGGRSAKTLLRRTGSTEPFPHCQRLPHHFLEETGMSGSGCLGCPQWEHDVPIAAGCMAWEEGDVPSEVAVVSWRHGAAADWQAELLGLGMAVGQRWTWIHATCLDCQHVGGTVTSSCHAGDLLQPSPKSLLISIALFSYQCCSCPCQGLTALPREC